MPGLGQVSLLGGTVVIVLLPILRELAYVLPGHSNDTRSVESARHTRVLSGVAYTTGQDAPLILLEGVFRMGTFCRMRMGVHSAYPLTMASKEVITFLKG